MHLTINTTYYSSLSPPLLVSPIEDQPVELIRLLIGGIYRRSSSLLSAREAVTLMRLSCSAINPMLMITTSSSSLYILKKFSLGSSSFQLKGDKWRFIDTW